MPQSQAEVDDDPLGAVLAHDLDHALVAHLGARVDRERRPEAAIEHLLHGLLVVVVDHHLGRREAMLLDHVHGAGGAALLVAVRRVDHHRQVELLGELELEAEIPVLEVRLLVVADLADRHDAVLEREPRQDLHHRLGQLLVVGLLGVEADRAIVADPELAGAKAFPADDGRQIVDVGADMGARLADPERRLDHRDHPGRRHGLVVVGGARDHVGVGIDEHHARASQALSVATARAPRRIRD